MLTWGPSTQVKAIIIKQVERGKHLVLVAATAARGATTVVSMAFACNILYSIFQQCYHLTQFLHHLDFTCSLRASWVNLVTTAFS